MAVRIAIVVGFGQDDGCLKRTHGLYVCRRHIVLNPVLAQFKKRPHPMFVYWFGSNIRLLLAQSHRFTVRKMLEKCSKIWKSLGVMNTFAPRWQVQTSAMLMLHTFCDIEVGQCSNLCCCCVWIDL